MVYPESGILNVLFVGMYKPAYESQRAERKNQQPGDLAL
jgi:hypothetical protein